MNTLLFNESTTPIQKKRGSTGNEFESSFLNFSPIYDLYWKLATMTIKDTKGMNILFVAHDKPDSQLKNQTNFNLTSKIKTWGRNY